MLTLHRPDKLKAMNRAAQEEHWQRGKMLNLELLSRLRQRCGHDRAAQYSVEKGARMGVVSRLVLLVTCLALSWLPAWAREMIGLGYQLVTLQNDNTLLQAAARAAIAATRDGAPKTAEKPAGLY